MSRSIRFILFLAVFALGISNAGNAWVSLPHAGTVVPQTVLSAQAEPAHASFNTGKDTDCLHIPYYGESGDNSAFDISNAILLQCNAFNGLGIPKTLKSHSAIRCLSFVDPDIQENSPILDDPNNPAANPSYRYYVYTLRHIIL